MKNLLLAKYVSKPLLSLLVVVMAVYLLTGLAYGATDVHLSNWFANGLARKNICVVGDSTTANATALFSEFNTFYRKEGEGLYGVGSILNFGEGGASLSAFLQDRVAHGITATIAAQADLYIFSYGINDVRLGQTTESQLTYLLTVAVNKIRAGVPNADIVLRMPNTFLTTDVNGYGYVQPIGNAPAYSTILRNAYKHLENHWDNVAVLDTQDAVFGRASPASSANMSDQIHPSSAGYIALAKALVDLIGKKSSYNPTLAANAMATNPAAPYTVYPRVVEDSDYYNLVATGRWVASSMAGASNGYVDLTWPENKSGDIHCGDLLQLDVNHVYPLPSNCVAVGLGQNTRIYNLGSSIPSFTMTGGTVRVWRRWQ